MACGLLGRVDRSSNHDYLGCAAVAAESIATTAWWCLARVAFAAPSITAAARGIAFADASIAVATTAVATTTNAASTITAASLTAFAP